MSEILKIFRKAEGHLSRMYKMKFGWMNLSVIICLILFAMLSASCSNSPIIEEVQISSIDWSISRNTNIPVYGMWYSKDRKSFMTTEKQYFKFNQSLFTKLNEIKIKLQNNTSYNLTNNIDTRISIIIKYKDCKKQDTLSYGWFIIKLNEKEYPYDSTLLAPIVEYLPISQQKIIKNTN